jgi:hypothetical protein
MNKTGKKVFSRVAKKLCLQYKNDSQAKYLVHCYFYYYINARQPLEENVLELQYSLRALIWVSYDINLKMGSDLLKVYWNKDIV